MHKFTICGLGPGHEDYILPKVLKVIKDADLIIGGKRHTDAGYAVGKEIINIEGIISNIPELIKANSSSKKICVLVSGDTGFYSLLKFLSKHFDENEYEVIPGISSLQYMFSKIKRTYQNQFIGSVHGRELNIIETIQNNRRTGLLTDAKWSPDKIAETIEAHKLEEITVHVGERLSYEDEVITTGTPLAIMHKSFDTLSVVIIENLSLEDE